MRKFSFLMIFIFAFSLGAYCWRVLHTSHSIDRSADLRRKLRGSPQKVLVEIGGSQISKDDVAFEYELLTKGLVDPEQQDMTPIPDFGDRLDEELTPLKETILNSLVERTMLYQLVKQDKSFNLSDSQRYVDCLKDWTATIDAGEDLFSSRENQDRLKARLCEQSILSQYLDEKVYSSVLVDEKSLLEYFKNNRDEFTVPAMVSIRQIVLADERQARKIRARVNRSNFKILARNHSITPEADDGGLLPPFPIGYGMPRFFEVAFSMRPGQISNILKSTYGFHIIMLEKKIKPREFSFAEAAPRVKKKLVEREKERAYQKWVDLALHSIKVSTPKVFW
ncbi:MAG: peptidylprolyl isomerase [Oligoflexales bacterium]|nr:peptidylprolyl isomerase [Oligoflexales bacterium]